MEAHISIPQIFLCLSGQDDAFVDEVWRHLPDGLAVFYRKSFPNGAKLLDEMASHVAQSSVFVFFASKPSLNSRWAGFEVDQARLASIMNPRLKPLVFPLSPDISVSTLPKWMQNYWVPRAGWRPRDIARYIRRIISSPPIALPSLSIPVFGRGQMLDTATQRWMAAVSETNSAPNIFLFAGIAGIGRRTFSRYFLEHSLPALPNLVTGPEIQLPEFADLADMFRGLHEHIGITSSYEVFEHDLHAFRNLPPREQVAEVVNLIHHFGKLGQAVFLITGSGLFEDRGELKGWVKPLMAMIAPNPEIKLCFVSNRQIREEEMGLWKNVMQLYIPPMKDADIRALMTATSTAYGIAPFSPNESLIRSIGGHPQIAKAAVRLVAQKGQLILEKNPAPLFSIQDEVLSENLHLSALTESQKTILCILSWVPQLDGKILEKVLGVEDDMSNVEFISALEDLLLGCLILVTENSFMISAAIREMFRRRYGYGPDGLLKRFSEVLKDEWAHARANNEFISEIFDAFVFMHALEGKSLPDEFKRLLLPSTLHDVIKETYDRGRDDDDQEALRRVAVWGNIARDMKMDDAVREEILSTVVHAHIRLSEYDKAESLIKIFDERGYRNAAFLRGFSLRRQDKYRDAVGFLRMAVATKKYTRSAVQELSVCYQKLGMHRELAELVQAHDDVVERSASLLDFKIGTLIASGQIRVAEEAIRRLQFLPQDDGRSVMRRAQIMMQRDGNFRDAERSLTWLVDNKIGRPVTVRRFRAMAALRAGHFDLARQDIQFIRARPSNRSTAQRLEVYFALAKSDYDAAEQAYAQLPHSDDVLRARILEARASDVHTPLSEREALRAQAAVLRAKNKLLTEFDFD